MTHLTPDELIDAVEGALESARGTHLASCERCRVEAEHLTSVLRDVRAVAAPEPSPLFWDQFASRVRTAIEVEGRTPPREWRWFEPRVLAPVSALALLVVALIWAVPQGSTGVAQARLSLVPAATAAATPAEEQWAMVFELAGDLDVDAAVESGFIGRPGLADVAVGHLSREEQLELMRLLREELRSGG